MKNFYKLVLLGGIISAATSFNASAADYITAPMTVSPANNTTMGSIGMIDIQWHNVDLVVADKSTAAKNQIDKSAVTVILNGEENTAWRNYMGSEIYVHRIEGSNEQNGGTDVYDLGYMLSLYLGTMSFTWAGDLQITIAEGVVESSTGEINPEINLHYSLNQVSSPFDINFSPVSTEDDPVEFEEGSGLIEVWWNQDAQISFNTDCSYPISVTEYEESGAPVGTIPMTGSCVIEDNKLIVNLSKLSPAKYSLTIPEGAIQIGIGVINIESYDYTFKIIGDNTAVGSLVDNSKNYDVFNLQGVRVLKTSDNSSLHSLPAGIYIVNGKKILVK